MTAPRPDSSDWVEGERVFGPPTGTYDADWVAGAARALVPGLGHERAALLAGEAWRALRSGTAPASLAQALGGGPEATAVATVANEFCALYGVDPRA